MTDASATQNRIRRGSVFMGNGRWGLVDPIRPGAVI